MGETRLRLDAHARPVAERAAVAAPIAPDLAALVAHYQRELRLLDWRLDVSYAPDLADSRGRPVWGLCYPTVDAKVATIVIRDPATPPDGATAEQAAKQVVETVVHELLHLHFAAFGTSSPAEIAHEEQVVWALAEALINAKGTAEEPMLARSMLAVIDASKGRASVGPAQNDVTSALAAALRARFPTDGESCQGPWVQDTFATSVVYELAGVLYEVGFAFDGTTATLGAEPVRVIRSYSPAPAPAPAPAPMPRQVTPKSRAATATHGEDDMASALSEDLVKMLIEAAASGDKKLAPLASAVLSELLGVGAPKPAADPAADPPPADAPPAAAARVVVAPPADDALAALGRAALALTGVSDPGEAIAEIARRSALAVGVEEREAAVARDRAVLELTERKALVASLVTLRAETPHTSGLAVGTLVPRLMAEPIAELRARVAALGGGKAPAARAVPGTDPLESLSERERAMCAEMKLDPATYAAHKARKVG